MLPADQLRPDAGQLALVPIGMQTEEGFGNHQPQHRVAQKFEALIVAIF